MKILVTDNLTGETRIEEVVEPTSRPLDAPVPLPTLDERITAVEATVDALTGGV